MRTPQQRKERAELVYVLGKIITEHCKDDTDFFIRLIWANEWISDQLMTFEDEGNKKNMDD